MTTKRPSPSAAEDRIARFLEAWNRKGDASDVIYGLGMFADEDGTRDLLASDLRYLLDLLAEVRAGKGSS